MKPLKIPNNNWSNLSESIADLRQPFARQLVTACTRCSIRTHARILDSIRFPVRRDFILSLLRNNSAQKIKFARGISLVFSSSHFPAIKRALSLQNVPRKIYRKHPSHSNSVEFNVVILPQENTICYCLDVGTEQFSIFPHDEDFGTNCGCTHVAHQKHQRTTPRSWFIVLIDTHQSDTHSTCCTECVYPFTHTHTHEPPPRGSRLECAVMLHI